MGQRRRPASAVQQVARAGLDAGQPLLLAAGSEGHSDQLEPLEPEQVEIDVAVFAPSRPILTRRPLTARLLQVGLEYRAADAVDDDVDAAFVGCRHDRVDLRLARGVDGDVDAERREPLDLGARSGSSQ